jgi:hypothetical protein
MGTNYFTKILVNGAFIKIHLGKRSCGSRFMWNHNNFKYYRTITDLKKFTMGKIITNDNFAMETNGESFMAMSIDWYKERDPICHVGESYMIETLMFSKYVWFR